MLENLTNIERGIIQLQQAQPKAPAYIKRELAQLLKEVKNCVKIELNKYRDITNRKQAEGKIATDNEKTVVRNAMQLATDILINYNKLLQSAYATDSDKRIEQDDATLQLHAAQNIIQIISDIT